MKEMCFSVKFTNHVPFKTYYPEVDQHTWDKWLIYDMKHCRDNQFKAWNSRRISYQKMSRLRVCKMKVLYSFEKDKIGQKKPFS